MLHAHSLLFARFEMWADSATIVALTEELIDAGAVPVEPAVLEQLRILEGTPCYGVDVRDNEKSHDLPQETGQTRALHFTKGCYLGQEIVERIRSRGNVHRHLRQLELTGPLPAGVIELHSDGGTVAGQITSAAELRLATGSRIFALGMIRGEFEVKDQAFSYGAGTGAGTARILAGPPAELTSS